MRSILLPFAVIVSSILAARSKPVPRPDGATSGLLLHDPPATLAFRGEKSSTQPSNLNKRFALKAFDSQTSSNKRRELPKVYVNLINPEGQITPGKDTDASQERTLSTVLGGALGLEHVFRDLVEYKGSYAPVSDAKKIGKEWVYLEFKGLLEKCKTEPCYGWIAKGGRFDPHDTLGTTRKDTDKVYVGLSKPPSPSPDGSPSSWERLVVYDAAQMKSVVAGRESKLPATKIGQRMLQEWVDLSNRFEALFEPHLSAMASPSKEALPSEESHTHSAMTGHKLPAEVSHSDTNNPSYTRGNIMSIDAVIEPKKVMSIAELMS
ncbi:hypothetical protein BDP27DRAFT_1451526 [Rhodocollybia butyracea]|uniref:Uncharacterized protein n=1 Tax=Rhodocollybia butyracea TaxID=206335 RepID=A0A9P5PGU1_9AGAR|nr:hypothetical protein BDP27DRAFT_1451526 [Rhodocollybia butyracea]